MLVAEEGAVVVVVVPMMDRTPFYFSPITTSTMMVSPLNLPLKRPLNRPLTLFVATLIPALLTLISRPRRRPPSNPKPQTSKPQNLKTSKFRPYHAGEFIARNSVRVTPRKGHAGLYEHVLVNEHSGRLVDRLVVLVVGILISFHKKKLI